MPQLSQRSAVMPASPIRKLVPFAVAAKKKGIKVYHLNIGQPDIQTPEQGLDALRHIDRKVLEYSPTPGIQSYRDKLVNYYAKYNINLTPDNIFITCGGSEAVMFAYMACLNPGDEIIIPEPAYANYMGFACETGVVVRTITTHIEDGFALPEAEEFERLITPRTRAIMICNPNNPTGTLYSDEELLKLRDIVKKHDLFLFADEVYREFAYNGKPYLSCMCLEGIEQNVVMIDSVSKRYSECGIRIGALITRNMDIMAAVNKFGQARLSPPLIGQLVAEASLDAPEQYHKDVYDEYIARRNCLVEGLNKIPGVFTPMPNGAFYTMVKLPVQDSDDFCRWCLEEFNYEGETVMMAPATGFYATPGAGKDQVRMAYVLKIEDLKRALVILEKALEAYNAR
ncbi:MAG: pyridoxal phosphate-dependent aminotransferase [Muribaculaceae bacterium]|nr:pyridoxal phosphate-dependent aminotransferase [Muribaculaceae bacterium]MBR1727223.1 pyridoxal phosphate-dependent aminotransferase [Muribaculaceae bacterium]